MLEQMGASPQVYVSQRELLDVLVYVEGVDDRPLNLMEEDETDYAGELFVPYQDLARQLGPDVTCCRYGVRDLSAPTRERMTTILDAVDAECGPAMVRTDRHAWTVIPSDPFRHFRRRPRANWRNACSRRGIFRLGSAGERGSSVSYP
jgi:hypothetical protein